MALGSFLRSCCAGDFRPYFLIEDDIDSATRQRRQIILSDSFILDMETTGYFDIEPLIITTTATADTKKARATSISLTLQMGPYSSHGAAATTCAALPISGFPRRLITEETGGGKAVVATAAALAPAGGCSSSVLVSEQRNVGDVSTADSVSAMSTSSPRPLSPDSVSPITTYTLASRSSTGSASLGAAGGPEKPRRLGGEVIAELPDHGSQAAELPSG